MSGINTRVTDLNIGLVVGKRKLHGLSTWMQLPRILFLNVSFLFLLINFGVRFHCVGVSIIDGGISDILTRDSASAG
jgi:hypothetical protein